MRAGLMRQAHTTPVYCVIAEQPIGSSKALKEIAQWNELFYKRWVMEEGRFPTEQDRSRALDDHRRAQTVIDEMIRQQTTHTVRTRDSCVRSEVRRNPVRHAGYDDTP